MLFFYLIFYQCGPEAALRLGRELEFFDQVGRLFHIREIDLAPWSDHAGAVAPFLRGTLGALNSLIFEHVLDFRVSFTKRFYYVVGFEVGKVF